MSIVFTCVAKVPWGTKRQRVSNDGRAQYMGQQEQQQALAH